MRRSRYTTFDEHRAGHTDLDQVSAMLDLLAHRLTDFIHAICDAVHACIIVRARFADGNESSRQAHTRTREFAALDPIAHHKLQFMPSTRSEEHTSELQSRGLIS